jgi:RNA polymerase sigma-70 factor (ECF subfamily)
METERREWEERGLRAAVLAGDEAAWRVLYERHFDAVYRYVYANAGRDVHRTEEIVQECWMIAVRRIRTFDPSRGGFGDWLRGMARQVILGQQRKWARRHRLAEYAPVASIATTATSGGVERLSQVLTSLPDHYESVLRAKYAEQRSVAEIARQWGRSSKAVESLLSRARTAFRKAWQESEVHVTVKEGSMRHESRNP